MAQQVETLRQALQRAFYGEPILVAYLHGSHANGHADDESDVDIAAVAERPLPKSERFKLQLRLMHRIAEETGIPLDEVDFTILQDAPMLLQYNVIRRGICIFERTKSDRIDFELRTEQAYEDELPYLERETELTLHRILHPSA